MYRSLSCLFRKFGFVGFILLMGVCGNIMAQPRVFLEMNKHLNEKPKFVFSFYSKNTFIVGQNARIFGIRPALEFNDRVRLGIGLYGLNTQITRVVIFPADSINAEADTLRPLIQFAYFTLFAEYAFYKSKRWEFGVPVSFGIGGSGYKEGEFVFRNRSIALVEASIYGQYYVFNWLAFNAGAGYRQMLKANQGVPGRFSGPVYALGIKVYLGKIYRGIFPKKTK